MRNTLCIVAGMVLLAGCGTSSGGSPSPPPAHPGPRAPDLAYPIGVATGTVASSSSHGATVTTATGPITLVFAAATRFVTIVPATRAAVTTGSCVLITPLPRPNPGRLVAAEITVATAADCRQPPAGAGPGGPSPGGGSATAAPDAVGGSPPPAPPLRPGLLGSRGTVASVSPNAIVLDVTTGIVGRVSRFVTTAATRYDKQLMATAADVVAGRCVSAVGTRPGTALDVTTVQISTPPAGGCPITKGRRGS